jgi:hypothetical protein
LACCVAHSPSTPAVWRVVTGLVRVIHRCERRVLFRYHLIAAIEEVKGGDMGGRREAFVQNVLGMRVLEAVLHS